MAAGRGRLVARRFLRNRPAVVAVAVLILVTITCFALPQFLPYSYDTIDYSALLQPPSPRHPFGTTAIGQDVLAQALHGAQKSLIIGFGVAVFAGIAAAIAGSVSGLLGGWTDRVIMWVVDLLLVVPSFILVMLFTPRTRGSGSILLLVVLFAVFGWMISARVVRGLTMGLREREFVRAARYLGASTARVIVSHIVPNVLSFLIIDTTLAVGAAIIAETSLSFLGLGVQLPEVSLGSLIGSGTRSALTYPWVFLFDSALLIIIVLCANLTGDGLRDAFDPSASRARASRRRSRTQPQKADTQPASER
jgi:peptide/nickel transport system permease protein